jgi:hypothetical protein
MELGNQHDTSTLSNGKPSSVQNFCPDNSRAAEQLVAQLQALEPSPVIISSNTDEGFLLVLHLNCQANLLQNYLHLNKVCIKNDTVNYFIVIYISFFILLLLLLFFFRMLCFTCHLLKIVIIGDCFFSPF